MRCASRGNEPPVGSTTMPATTAQEMRDHWVWRPEWTPERTCLYWYIIFEDDQIAAAVGESALEEVRRTPWLDAIPPRWCHVTLTDIGFADELDDSEVRRVRDAVARSVSGEHRLPLVLGPVQAYRSALVLATGPLSRLRGIRTAVRRATSDVLRDRHADVHGHVFWPHVSLGYVNRSVDTSTVDRFLRALPVVESSTEVDALTLAAVTRRDRHYQWEVRAQVELAGAG
jgi:2'-5' RNA ligase